MKNTPYKFTIKNYECITFDGEFILTFDLPEDVIYLFPTGISEKPINIFDLENSILTLLYPLSNVGFLFYNVPDFFSNALKNKKSSVLFAQGMYGDLIFSNYAVNSN